jgi:hypothetical protein
MWSRWYGVPTRPVPTCSPATNVSCVVGQVTDEDPHIGIGASPQFTMSFTQCKLCMLQSSLGFYKWIRPCLLTMPGLHPSFPVLTLKHLAVSEILASFLHFSQNFTLLELHDMWPLQSDLLCLALTFSATFSHCLTVGQFSHSCSGNDSPLHSCTRVGYQLTH